MTRTVKEALEAYGACFPKVGKAVQDQIEEGMELGKLLDSITINMPLPIADKQKILSAISVRERFSILTEPFQISAVSGRLVPWKLQKRLDISAFHRALRTAASHIFIPLNLLTDFFFDIRQRIDKNQRDYILREQMQYIKEELGENNTDSDVEQFLALPCLL